MSEQESVQKLEQKSVEASKRELIQPRERKLIQPRERTKEMSSTCCQPWNKIDNTSKRINDLLSRTGTYKKVVSIRPLSQS